MTLPKDYTAEDLQNAFDKGRETGRKERVWKGLDAEEIRTTDHHMVIGAYHYSFKQGARWAEGKLKERNYDTK